MDSLAIPIPDTLVDALARAVADRALELLRDDLDQRTPWMTTEEASEYTRIPLGTFKQLSAAGTIPSSTFEGRRKLYHRAVLDEWLLGYARDTGPGGRVRPLRRADAA